MLDCRYSIVVIRYSMFVKTKSPLANIMGLFVSDNRITNIDNRKIIANTMGLFVSDNRITNIGNRTSKNNSKCYGDFYFRTSNNENRTSTIKHRKRTNYFYDSTSKHSIITELTYPTLLQHKSLLPTKVHLLPCHILYHSRFY